MTRQLTWKFESTADAYDATQCNDDIHDGDILLIANECVVGVADTWPMAVTVAHGELHPTKPTISWHDIAVRTGIDYECFRAARELARQLGYPTKDFP